MYRVGRNTQILPGGPRLSPQGYGRHHVGGARTGSWPGLMHPDFPMIAKTLTTGRPVVLAHDERARHAAAFGKSGSGKSTLLLNLAMGDVHQGHGLAVIDPHGDLAEAIIDAMPRSRVHDVCYLNVADADYPVGFNPLAGVPPARSSRVPAQ